MNKILSFAKETIKSLTFMFPLAFAIAACLGFSEVIGILFACIAMIFVPTDKFERSMPVYGAFLIMGFVLKCYGATALLGTFLICSLLLIISSFFFEKLKKLFASPAVSGVMLATALTATVLFTTHYFGIGASGNTTREMIASYISLGFHANWRGVLYGTIVMVIMITLPKKFKKFSEIVSASFVAIISTLLLNLVLNPADMATSITEIADGTKSDILSLLLGRFEATNIIYAIPAGIALFLISFYAISQNENARKNDYIIAGAANAAVGGIFRFPLPWGIKAKNIIPGVVAAAITLLMTVFGENFILRIPLHSCAVVIIVGAWHSVKWSKIKSAFSGILPFACFVLSVLSCLLIDFASGVLISFGISLLFTVFSKDLKILKKS